jgi:hypothetical protein
MSVPNKSVRIEAAVWEELEVRAIRRVSTEYLYADWFGPEDHLGHRQMCAVEQICVDLKKKKIADEEIKAFAKATAAISDNALSSFGQWDDIGPAQVRIIQRFGAKLSSKQRKLLLPAVDKMTDIGLSNLIYLRKFERAQEKSRWKKQGRSTYGQLCQGLRPGSNGVKEVVAK